MIKNGYKEYKDIITNIINDIYYKEDKHIIKNAIENKKIIKNMV